jgi:hypothetical protein
MKLSVIGFILCAVLAAPAFAQASGPAEGKQGEDKQAREHHPGRLGQRLRKNRLARHIWRELTPQEREAVKERMKQRREEHKARREEWKAKWDAMTPEEKEAFKAKVKATREEAQKKVEELRERLKGMTPEERKAEFERLRDEFKKKRAEQK